MKVVFLHALPSDGRMWEHTAELLGLETVAPDRFGLGDSTEEWAAEALVGAHRPALGRGSIGPDLVSASSSRTA